MIDDTDTNWPPEDGTQGPPGPGTVEVAIAAVTLSGHRVVTPQADGEVRYADASLLGDAHRALWFTENSLSIGDTGEFKTQGLITEPSWSWTDGLPIYLGLTGLITQTLPSLPTSLFVLEIGTAVGSDSMYYLPKSPIVLS